jgi:hypothetical protein
MSRSIEIIGRYIGERFRFANNDSTSVIIGSILVAPAFRDIVTAAGVDPCEPVSIKGEADPNEIQVNATYRFFGHWAPYDNRRTGRREQQFAFRTFVQHIPHDAAGIADYLSNAGRGNGVGPVKARKLVEAIGIDEVLQVCRTQPSEVAKIIRIDQTQAERFADKLKSQQATENATLEIDKLLNGRGFSKSLTRKAIKAWGNHAAKMIAEDPYSLMQFRGVGFGLTDRLWIELGKGASAIERQALCAWYSMAKDNDGHTWFPVDHVTREMQKMIGGVELDFRAAIIRGKEYGQLSDDHYGAIATIRTQGEEGPIAENAETLWLAEGKHAAAERYVAEAIARAQSETTAQTLTTYSDIEHAASFILKHATCHRCRRQLTAPTVHVLDGIPYGPTCIGYVDTVGAHEVFDRDEWLQRNPVVHRWIEQQPSGIIRLPEVSLWPDPNDIEGISDHQRANVGNALMGRIGILGGSPGTGKTYTLAAIIKAMYQSGLVSLHQIGIGAPTGKAAVRLTEALQAAGLPVRARTWHSLLGVGGQGETDSGEWSFQHNEKCPWPFKVVFGDESSMLPINMMAAILKARAPGCHMLFVGDVNQLPPVGNGAPFRDMIAAKLPYGELRKIERNSGGIVEACAAIRDEQPWIEDYQDGNKNLLITGESDAESQLDRVMSLIYEASEAGSDAIWDIQVLTAVNQRSKLSRAAINLKLQDSLNPNPKIDGTPFRVNDKIVCLKNGFYKSIKPIRVAPGRWEERTIKTPKPADWESFIATYVPGVDGDDDRYFAYFSDEEISDFIVDPTGEYIDTNEEGEVYVANGELGEVQSIEPKHLTVRLEHPERLIQVPRGRSEKKDDDEEATASTGCHWDLGYALSVHKFQGSEQKIVIVLLDDYPGARMVCDRAWTYTSISRAKDRCFLVGTPRLAERFCKVQKMNGRKTFLANRIALATFERQAVEL